MMNKEIVKTADPSANHEIFALYDRCGFIWKDSEGTTHHCILPVDHPNSSNCDEHICDCLAAVLAPARDKKEAA